MPRRRFVQLTNLDHEKFEYKQKNMIKIEFDYITIKYISHQSSNELGDLRT